MNRRRSRNRPESVSSQVSGAGVGKGAEALFAELGAALRLDPETTVLALAPGPDLIDNSETAWRLPFEIRC